MGISKNCGLMIGLPYEELEALFTKVGRNDLDDLIDYGELDIGSVHYDSDREYNIVGQWLTTTSGSVEITPEWEGKVLKICEGLEKDYPNIEFKLYLTLSIT